MGMPWLLASCVSVQALPTPTPTNTSAPPTPTVAFPTLVPTATPTPRPTATPTPDILAGLGEVLLLDEFDQPSGWTLSERPVGGASYVQGRLSLAVHEPRAFYMALSPLPPEANIYLEVKARAEVCGLDDEYGLVFRVTPAGEHYRFTLNCNGEIRVSRITGADEIPLLPRERTFAAIPGPLVENRLGVLAEGTSFRFFLNGIEVFAREDPTYPQGSVGLMVRSKSDGLITASFDDFLVRALKPGSTATASEP